MTLIQKLNTYKHFIIARFLPKQRRGYLNYYSKMEMPEEFPENAENVCYRLMDKGVMVKQATINFITASEQLYKKQEALPLVSCLMVTKNRFHLAQKAVQCFIEQNYPNKELILVDDGSDTQLRDWVKNLQKPQIRFFHLPDESKKLGELRNLSRQYAKGNFVAQWDDDDLSHPDRLLFQMALIQKYGLDGCTLQREQLWFAAKNRFGYSIRRIWEGAMVCINEKLPLYHESRKGEETYAVHHLAQHGKIALLDFPQLYTYCFHGKNTWDEPHFEELWEHSTKVFEGEEYQNKMLSLRQFDIPNQA